jgi:histidinol-phosphatase
MLIGTSTSTLRPVNDAAQNSYAEDLALALRLANEADTISMRRFRSTNLEVITKPDRTPVTDADRGVEHMMRTILGTEKTGDSIYGEEFGIEGNSERQWIIDPIDGTANFLRGVPIWATLIALAVDGHPKVGVVSAPALGKRWWAATGSGAWVSDISGMQRRLGVSNVTTLADASISFNSIAQWDQAGYLEKLIALTRKVWRDRAYGDMWSYMLLAEGLVDIVGEFGIQPYDVAALIPIIEEAGGRFSSVDGSDGPFTDGSAIATNRFLHENVLTALHRVPEE